MVQERATAELAEPGRPGACLSLTWGRDGTRMHYGKKASLWRQCDALGNILLGKTSGLGIHLDVTLTRTTYLNIIIDQVHPFTAMVFPNDSGLFQQDNAPCHSAKIFQEWFEENAKGFK
ncbi:hypothetical protein P4O66_016854, partial [Electrophorus voltai]